MRNLIRHNFITVFALICLLGSCSSGLEKKVDMGPSEYGSKDFVESLVASIEPNWFSTDPRFALTGPDGAAVPHMFYDIDPKINVPGKTLNFIATTPQNFPIERKIDLASGQLTSSRRFCEKSDAWNRYKKTIGLPPFTTGVVPRALDQINEPQKIIVFGQDGYYQKYYLSNYFDARIVGGLIEQVCPARGCVEDKSWLSRLVLVGVQRENQDFKEVKDLESLKKKVDWELVKAFIGNGRGSNNVGGRFYPGYRMGAEVGPSQALAFFEKNSQVFTEASLEKLGSGCRKLYAHMMDELTTGDFKDSFKSALKKYGDRAATCQRYVYPFSVNVTPDKHWFFTFILGHIKLVDMGHRYDCGRKFWTTNPRLASGKRMYDVDRAFKGCDARDLDQAMTTLVRYLEVLKESDRDSLRYVAYDGRGHGTHKKIYGWVDMDNKAQTCANDKKAESFKKSLQTFPDDVHWKDVKAAALGDKNRGEK